MDKEKWTRNAYERWDKRNKSKGIEGYFEGEYYAEKSRLKNLKGRVQNHIEGLLRLVITALIVLLQILLILFLPIWLRNSTVYFYFILELCSVVAVVTLVNKNDNPSFRIAWISLVLLLPVSGFILYFLWGWNGGKRKKLDGHIRTQISYGRKFLIPDKNVSDEYISKKPVAGRMVKYMTGAGIPLTKDNAVKYYKMGEDAFEDICEALEHAGEYILMNFFIVAEGALWDQIHEILKRKAEEGVEIKFMYDDFGTAVRTRKYFKQILEHEGIEVRVFNPIHKYTGQLYANYRSHQKNVIIDGKIAFTGGFNLADEYANLVERFGVWKDTGICVAGEAVWDMTVVFLQMWEACEKVEKHIDYLRYKRQALNISGGTYCQVISDGPALNPINTIERLYLQMINFSDQYLYITTPYLIIEDDIQQSLAEAARRGVDVRIITPNIPDKKYAKLLTNYNYGRLLAEGVRIYEYTPGFIHAKQILSENAAIVGSINMDYRSFYLHYEIGVWMSGKKIQKRIGKDFEELFEISKEITYEEWLQRPRRYKIIQPILNLFSTLF